MALAITYKCKQNAFNVAINRKNFRLDCLRIEWIAFAEWGWGIVPG